MGCPKKYPDTPVTQKLADSKYNVRCCSSNGDSCSSEPCESDKTYHEAVEICSSRDLRLCYEHEVNKCCGRGCGHDNIYIWIAVQLQGTVQAFSYIIFIKHPFCLKFRHSSVSILHVYFFRGKSPICFNRMPPDLSRRTSYSETR